ncbi:hypothetical protein NE235_14995 [Actinoallomurus spadix]|uniref:Uncharacterized protein n=1 Tax=Actinoallomurus spadix TaxID=79912 RepID=A0ABP3G4P7_9ACTN|nr:hypothetical protein [Actinoallomurus spadix]MCO5987411.1 hypothetical protein [Actinoallomurus spadix]
MTRPQRAPRPTLDLNAVRTHLHEARSARVPVALWVAVADLPMLIAEVERLRSLLALARAQYAGLLAAARATVAAERDGEDDPLLYLRDELDEHGQLPDEDLHAAELLALVGLREGGR